VILAAGRGERMGAGRNKALLELAGRPLLLHSLETFRAICDRVLMVAAEEDVAVIEQLLPDLQVVTGGNTRQGSERNALQELRSSVSVDHVLAFHDAARPLVAPDDVQAVFVEAERLGAAMLGAAAKQPALLVRGGGVRGTYEARQIWRAQTPQAARASWLLAAYDRAAADGFDGTDTAAVLARAGYTVRVVPATVANPKITIRADLTLAEQVLQARISQ